MALPIPGRLPVSAPHELALPFLSFFWPIPVDSVGIVLSQTLRGVDSVDPSSDGKDTDHSENAAAELFDARCQSLHVLNAAEETLDDVALGVKPGVVGDRVSETIV